MESTNLLMVFSPVSLPNPFTTLQFSPPTHPSPPASRPLFRGHYSAMTRALSIGMLPRRGLIRICMPVRRSSFWNKPQGRLNVREQCCHSTVTVWYWCVNINWIMIETWKEKLDKQRSLKIYQKKFSTRVFLYIPLNSKVFLKLYFW